MVIFQTFQILSISLTSVLVGVKFIFAYLLFNKYRNNKEIQMLLGACLLFLFLGIGRIFMMVFDYLLTGFNPNLLQTYIIFYKIGNSFTWIGLFCFTFASEKAIFSGKTRYLISITYAVFIVISSVPIDFVLSQTLAAIPTAFALVFIPISYIYLAKNSVGEPRTKSLIILAGFIVYFIFGYVILVEGFSTFFASITQVDVILVKYIIHTLSASIKIVGIFLLYLGYVKEPKEP